MKQKKLIIIGLDGADWDILNPLIEKGALPNFKKLIDNGIATDLLSTIPPITPAAWTSFATGANPGKHGIFDFTYLDKDGKIRLVSSKNCKVPYFWEFLPGKTIVINLPITYPAKPINGIMITGMLTPSKYDKNFIYPPEEHKRFLEKFPEYVIELSWAGYYNKENKLVEDIIKMTEERIKVFKYYLENGDWDIFVGVFVGSDRLQHLLMTPESLEAYYKKVDSFLGYVLKKFPEYPIIILSDHGFKRIKWEISLPRLVQKISKTNSSSSEFLTYNLLKKLQNIYKKLPLELRNILKKILKEKPIQLRGKVFKNKIFIPLGTMGCLYWNRKLAYIEKIDEKTIIEKLKKIEGIQKVLKKEEIYFGNRLDTAPDFVIIPQKDYAFKLGIDDKLISPSKKRGDHRIRGILILYHPDKKLERKSKEIPFIWDVPATIFKLLGKEVPSHMDGKSII